MNLSSFSTSQEFNDFLNKAYEVGYRSKLFAQSRGDYYSLILSKIISEVGVTHSLDFMLSESENFFLIDYLRLDGCISDLNELINWCINNIKFLSVHDKKLF